MMSRIGHHFREGFRNVLRNGWMTFASISSVIVTLAVLGLSLVLAMNAQQISTYVANQVQFSAYLNVSASDQTAAQVASQVRQISGVASVQLITKQQGMKQLEKELGSQYNEVLKGFKSNPLPDQLIVKATNPRDTVPVSNQVAKLPQIVKVNNGSAVVSKLFHTLDVIRDVGLIFVFALLITSIFLISNTIRITIFSRRREIEIMKLVGATDWYIRWPFIVEGMIIGVSGAVVPFVLLAYGYHILYGRVHSASNGIPFPLVANAVLTERLALILIGIGVFIGIWGGAMSVRKFLKV